MPNSEVLTVTAIQNKESVLLSVKDTGDGIPTGCNIEAFYASIYDKVKGPELGISRCKTFN